MPTTIKDADPDEARRVIAWEMNRIIDLGFSPTEAQELVLAGIDWHELDDLLRAGCPLEQAKAILL